MNVRAMLRPLAAAALTVGACASAGYAAAAPATLVVTGPADVTWSAAPASLPAGTQIVLLAGDPSKPGPFVLRLKFPANTVIAPHKHATAENVTAITGSFYHEVGDTIDKSHGTLVNAGGFVYLPGMTSHSLWTTGQETIVQVTGTGPFGLIYDNPADDPSRAAR